MSNKIQGKFNWVCIGIAVLVVVAACGSTQGTGTASQKYTSVTLRWAEIVTPTSALGESDQWYAQQVTKATAGHVRFQFGWSGAYGAATEVLPELKTETADLATISPGSAGVNLPYMSLLGSLGFLFDSAQQADDVGNALVKAFPEYQREAKAVGLRFLWSHAQVPYVTMEDKPACSLSAFKGLSARSFGPYAPAVLEAAGLTPVTLDPADFYTSISRGLVNQIANPPDGLLSYSLQEVAKYLCTASVGTNFGPQVYFSLKQWNAFTPDTRSVMQRIAQEMPAHDLAVQNKATKAALQEFKKSGVKLLIFPNSEEVAWKKAAPSVLDEWVETMTKSGDGSVARRVAAKYRALTKGSFHIDTTVYTSVYNK